MNETRFIGDLHLGHVNMALKRGFATVEEHDEYIISQWNKVVNKKDITWILGDITMEKSSSYHLLNRLNGMKKVVLGNHDRPSDVTKLLQYVNFVSGMFKYKGIWLTHCPVHPMELEYNIKRNIHGHIHEHLVNIEYNIDGNIVKIPDNRYHCVSCERVDYVPQTLKQLGIER